MDTLPDTLTPGDAVRIAGVFVASIQRTAAMREGRCWRLGAAVLVARASSAAAAGAIGLAWRDDVLAVLESDTTVVGIAATAPAWTGHEDAMRFLACLPVVESERVDAARNRIQASAPWLNAGDSHRIAALIASVQATCLVRPDIKLARQVAVAPTDPHAPTASPSALAYGIDPSMATTPAGVHGAPPLPPGPLVDSGAPVASTSSSAPPAAPTASTSKPKKRKGGQGAGEPTADPLTGRLPVPLPVRTTPDDREAIKKAVAARKLKPSQRGTPDTRRVEAAMLLCVACRQLKLMCAATT